MYVSYLIENNSPLPGVSPERSPAYTPFTNGLITILSILQSGTSRREIHPSTITVILAHTPESPSHLMRVLYSSLRINSALPATVYFCENPTVVNPKKNNVVKIFFLSRCLQPSFIVN